jgi:signal transduction histidine kinase
MFSELSRGYVVLLGLIILMLVLLARYLLISALMRQRAGEAATNSEEGLRDLMLASLTRRIVVLNREGTVVAASNHWAKKFQDNAACPKPVAATGNNYLEIVQYALGNSEKATALDGIRAVCQGETDHFEMEYSCWQQNERHWFAMTVISLMDSTGTVVVAHRDISREKQTEQAIRELSRKLILAQEEERSRIARELHDDISQQLALLSIDVRRIQGANETAPAAQIQELCEKIDNISDDLRRISHRLHSSKLDYLGLVAALRGLCEEFSEQYDLVIDFQLQPVPVTLDAEISLSLFRIAQEALRNAATHSNARNIRVELRCSTSDLSLRVSDDGVGFDSASIKSKAGLGVISMQERMRLVGGILTIESKPSQGTLIEAYLPLQKVPFVMENRGASSAA